MKEFHREDFANRTGLAQAWTVKSADRLFTLSDHTDCCGSECKLSHVGACSLNSPRLILVDSGSNVCHAWTFLLSLSMGHCTLVD